ncbi:MAG TPA: hypothetical protein VKA89_09720 [Solirubrobacterales bacterium]|nr:hypothetical protein [Solirubrobacterales bacterium]
MREPLRPERELREPELRELPLRAPLLRELEDRLRELLRELDDELRRDPEPLRDERRRRRPPLLRCDAGTSEVTTPLVSVLICRSRNFAIRTSSRRIERAIWAVSLSPTFSANASSVR